MVLLALVTINSMLLVPPILLGDVEVTAREIAQSLIVMLLTPLAIGFFLRARFENAALKIKSIFCLISNIAFSVMNMLGLVLNVDSLIALVGAFGILAWDIIGHTFSRGRLLHGRIGQRCQERVRVRNGNA